MTGIDFTFPNYVIQMESADLTVSGDIKISHLAVIGNTSTVLAFVLTLYTCPTEYWEIWVSFIPIFYCQGTQL